MIRLKSTIKLRKTLTGSETLGPRLDKLPKKISNQSIAESKAKSLANFSNYWKLTTVRLKETFKKVSVVVSLCRTRESDGALKMKHKASSTVKQQTRVL